MLNNQPIYLDYAATTPVDDIVIETLLPYLGKNGLFGNSGSNHLFGKQVSVAIELARKSILNIVNGLDHQLIWTSGATEANNLAIKGLFSADAEVKFNHIITCKTEHKSVIESARSLGQQGYKVTYLNPSPDGLIDLEQLARALENKAALVSIMMVNNETGVIQDIEKIAALTKKHNSILHCDCSQAFGKLKIDLHKLPIDLMSISGHKIYAPKGIGALIIHKNILPLLSGQIQGGDQELCLRAGTLPSQQIIALSKACEIADNEMDYNNQKIQELSEIFLQGVTKIPHTLIHGHREQKVPHTVSLSFDCVNSRTLQNMIADQIAISLGSACNSESLEPSYVLRSMGLPQDVTSSAIRISFGKYTTKDEVSTSLQVLQNSVNLIRNESKIWNLKSSIIVK